jgi:hypothetical protein
MKLTQHSQDLYIYHLVISHQKTLQLMRLGRGLLTLTAISEPFAYTGQQQIIQNKKHTHTIMHDD